MQRTGDRLEQMTAKIIELEAARAKPAADYREAEAYVQQLQQAAGDGNRAAGVQAARTLIRDLSQIGTIPAEIATLLMNALTAPPTPDGTPPVATKWGKIRAIMDGPPAAPHRGQTPRTQLSPRRGRNPREPGSASSANPGTNQDTRQQTSDQDQTMEGISTYSSSDSNRGTGPERCTTRPHTNSEDPVEAPSQSTVRSPPPRKQKHSRESRPKSPARRRRSAAVINARKPLQPPRPRRQSPTTTDTSIAEDE